MVNGPLLALVSAAILGRHRSQITVLAGFASGLMANASVAWLLPDVSWLWWNVIGFVVAITFIGTGHLVLPATDAELNDVRNTVRYPTSAKGLSHGARGGFLRYFDHHLGYRYLAALIFRAAKAPNC